VRVLDHMSEAVAVQAAAARHQRDQFAAYQAARAYLATVDPDALVDVAAHMAALTATELEPRYPDSARQVISTIDRTYLDLSWWWEAVSFSLAWLEPGPARPDAESSS
jgi:hypothetical protein